MKSKNPKAIRIESKATRLESVAMWLMNLPAKRLAAECKARGIPVAKYKVDMAARLGADIMARGQKFELTIR